ncbi:MAG: transglutaminase domain-containing protein [Myxococcota bacterium]|nr:transglutaminase domain-containing protein [Myxococcota bacterium]
MRRLFFIIAGLWAVVHPRPAMCDLLTGEAHRVWQTMRDDSLDLRSAVQLIRLSELVDWMPPGWVEKRLRAASQTPTHHPLVRAVALWRLRQHALDRLDEGAARTAVAELGLQTNFVYRAGRAASPTDTLRREDWQTYPPAMGYGVVWLDSLLRPRQRTWGTLATDVLTDEAGPAVLRFGYDDRVRVWLNGVQIYAAEDSHGHWLDQAAVPIHLRAGKNRLMVEVYQQTNAWRFLMRITDRYGVPLKITTQAAPWGPVPNPADGPLQPPAEQLWTTLHTAATAPDASDQAIRDLADFARVARLPSATTKPIENLLEARWRTTQRPQTLLAWLRIASGKNRPRILEAWAAKTNGHDLDIRGGTQFATLMISIEQAWHHFFGGRSARAWQLVDTILRDHPDLLPANELVSALYVDVGLVQRATIAATDPRAKRHCRAWYRAKASSLQQAGRIVEERAALDEMRAVGLESMDSVYRRGTLAIAAGDLPTARQIFDGLVDTRPALWSYSLDLIDALVAHGYDDEAHTRLRTLWASIPGDESVGRRLIHLAIQAGRFSEGQRYLAALERAQVDAEKLDRLRHQLALHTDRPELGPSTSDLLGIACPPEVSAYVLYQHAIVHVDARGRADRWIRRVLKLCASDPTGRHSVVDMTFVPGLQRLEVITAKRFRANQPTASPQRSDYGLSDPEARIFFDVHNERLDFAQSRAGDVIEVVWRLKDNEAHPAFPGHYSELAYLQEAIPRRISVVEHSTDAPMNLYRSVVEHGVALEASSGRIVAKDVPGIPVEPDMPGPTESYAHVHLSSLDSWDRVEETYEALLSDRADVTPSVKALAFDIIAQNSPRPRIIEALYTAVMQRIRYVGLEYGIHGFQPHRPMETWRRGYGDCKDKALLLFALLKAHNIRSQFTLVRTRSEGAIQPRPASWAVFNHAMLYLPDDQRFLDATVDQTALGDLPPGDEGASVLIVGQRQGVSTVPVKPSVEHTSDWSFQLDLGADASLAGRAQWSATGTTATNARRMLQDLGRRIQGANASLSKQLPGARWQTIENIALQVDGRPFRLAGTISSGRLNVEGERRFMEVGLRPWHLARRFAPGVRRTHARVLPHARTIRLKYVLTAPSNMTTSGPESLNDTNQFGGFNSEVIRRSNQISVTIEFRLTGAVVSAEKDADFRRWLTKIDRYLGQRIEVYPRER